MISRRLIRIKVFKIFFSKLLSGTPHLVPAEKELLRSCDSTLELYFFILLLPIALKDAAIEQIEIRKNKRLNPTDEDKNPNPKFVNNKVIEKLENDQQLSKAFAKSNLFWREHRVFVKSLLTSITQKEYYQEYMQDRDNNYNQDLLLIQQIFSQELEHSQDLESILEDYNMFWPDELAFVLNIIISKIGSTKQENSIKHPQVFINEEDREFALRLLNLSLIWYERYIELISKYAVNWDSGRMASMDLSLIIMGICEAVNFPNIPLRVTINEYVEISKFYSTENSPGFINGLLDKILQDLKNEGKIEKSGRGLLESTL